MLDEWEMLYLGTGIVMCRRITTDRMSDSSGVHGGHGFVRWRNGSVAWMARKLKFVPLSTCEAEVASMVGMIKEGLFVVEIDTARHGCADQWENTGHYRLQERYGCCAKPRCYQAHNVLYAMATLGT